MKIHLPLCNPVTLSAAPLTGRVLACTLGLSAALSALLSAHAGSFSSDFNSGLPANTTVFGNSVVDATGGFTNSGCLKLTTNGPSLTAGFVITNDLDAGTPVVSFTATFKALIGGGTGADGFSFNFAPDLPFAAISEEGDGTGLTVSFDTFANTGDTIGVTVKSGGTELATLELPAETLRANTFVDVFIQLAPDGNLDVLYDGVYAHTNLATGITSITNGYFGFGARTGGSTDNHFIDNLRIITRTNAAAFVDYYSPIGRQVRADTPIQIVLTDNNSSVNASSIILKLDGAPVIPSIAQSAPNTTISYTNPTLFASGSSHTVELEFADNAVPTPNTNLFAYSFTVGSYNTLPTNLVAPGALVSANPGFTLRVSQIDVNLGATIQRAERQLANLLIDPGTLLPYTNLATTNPVDSSFTYTLTNTINMSVNNGRGNFLTDDPMPGLPGTTGGTTNVAMDAVTYIHLTAGTLYTLGVNSSDGFRLTVASTPDLFATQQAVFDGVRDALDTTTTFTVAQTGYYPFRILYMVGGLEVVNPTTNNPALEFFSVDATATRILINDTNTPGYLPAYLPAATLPHIRSVSPAVGDSGVPRTSPIQVTLVNGSITVQTNTIELQLNSSVVAPSISTDGSGVTTVQFQPPTPLALNSTNTVQIAFTDSASTRRTNSWQFVVENILSPLWVIPPASATNATWAKWVTSGATERGLAYNPKTGHVLLVSRNTATGVDGPGGLGIAVLDGNTGLFIKKLDVGTGIIAGGTFAANMIDVADDGVIYMCNLATSAAQNFRIYRWHNEDAIPEIAYSAPPTAAAGNPRWGDDFAVRRSGAGTQIISSGNNGSANTVPVFTTVDGTNFTRTLLVPVNLPNGSVRLGIAFGCGNTFYGETTGAGNDLRYVSFTGPPSTAASLTASYRIVDGFNVQSIGPIGVDIVNQRLIGDSTTGAAGTTHSMNLFDIPSLVVSPTTNRPIDTKNFATSTGSFGTGAVDFSPDGSRLYTLDTGNGIIAFSLAPKVAPATICSQPENFIAPAGNIGFFGVTAIGSPQTFQWRYHGLSPSNVGTNLPGATGGTLDIYYIDQAKLGYYSVVINGSVTSSIVYLDSLLTITNQPDSQIVAISGTATLEVGFTGGVGPYTYQWKHNGTNNVGGNSSSLTINNAQVSNAGAYTVVITDLFNQSTTSQVAVLTVGTAGTGTGLTADYFNLPLFTTPAPDDPFYGTPTLSRIDSTVDFDWGTASPDPSIAPDHFSARWSGQVQPFYSETYTLYARSDDGSRLWVNGQLLANFWAAQAPTEHSGNIALVANQKYDLLMEYFERASGAVAQLSWSSPSQVKQIIPMTQLYPSASLPIIQPLKPSLVGTNLVLNWTGTFVLESAPVVTGPWSPIATNVGPYQISVEGAGEMYFRLVNHY